MAPIETKFHLSRIVASAAVFISLCVPTTTAEVRRCYWCGPLAEQVHRSQRALPCDARDAALTQDTVCDPGYPYCAVVATSPPYVESRYCVKLYQDECYLLYCNSTRTWRMTCPCRGDLCNGPNGEREEDAFAGLAKVVAKAQSTRIKRALISTSGFISMNTNRKNRIDNATIEGNKSLTNDTIDANNEEIYVTTNETQLNDVNAAKQVDGNKETQKHDITHDTTAADDYGKESLSLPLNKSPTAEVEIEIDSQTNSPNINADETVNYNDIRLNETSIQIDVPSVNAESDDLKTEIILMSSDSESTKLVNTTVGIDIITHANPDTQITTPENITPTVETTPESPKTPTETKLYENTVKPSEKLPTAGALLHNMTPAAITTQETTFSTAVLTTQHIEPHTTTETRKPQNNTAVRIDAHILTVIVGVILGY